MSYCGSKHKGKVGSWLINGTIVDKEVQRLYWLESWLENSSHKVDRHLYSEKPLDICIYLHFIF